MNTLTLARRLALIIAAIASLALVGAAQTPRSSPADFKPTVILVSFDGFRWD